ncbi:MAG: nuclear transport factor 2 family protein [Bacteroidota bacterium]
MKRIFLLMCCISVAHTSFAQSAKDSADIRATALNYVEGWYEGNAERMAKAVHPKLAKRIVGWSEDVTKNENVLSEMNGEQLVERTGKGYGKRISKERQIKNITILSIYNNTASVKAEMSDWYDFMHIGRWNGEWKIINVLWEMKPQQ